MYKKQITWIAVFAIILGIAALFLLRNNPGDERRIVRIYSGGELEREIDLDAVTEEYSIPIESGNGGVNELLVSGDGIEVVSADCPDKLCIKRGRISHSGIPIICLPNELVIEIAGESEYDAVAGR